MPHTASKGHTIPKIKASWVVRVPPVVEDGKERLPTKKELGAILQYLKKDYKRTFVTFLLPGMEGGAGTFATAHHNPTM